MRQRLMPPTAGGIITKLLEMVLKDSKIHQLKQQKIYIDHSLRQSAVHNNPQQTEVGLMQFENQVAFSSTAAVSKPVHAHRGIHTGGLDVQYNKLASVVNRTSRCEDSDQELRPLLSALA